MTIIVSIAFARDYHGYIERDTELVNHDLMDDAAMVKRFLEAFPEFKVRNTFNNEGPE